MMRLKTRGASTGSARTDLDRARPALFAVIAAAVLTAGCEPVPVVPTQDRRQNVQTSRIEGEVLVQGAVRGNAIVSLFDATRPPPPKGSGRPVAFAFIPASELFGEVAPGFAGPFTAPFSFSLVAPGQYIVQGFIDADGCHPEPTDGCRPPDFNPWTSVTGEPNRGDVGGAAIADAATRALRVLDVTAEKPVTGVTVSFSESASTVPFDRPVFEAGAPFTFDPAQGPKVLELRPLPLQQGPVDERQPAFVARYVDADNDGTPDDANGDGEPDLWPRVVVRKLADAGLADENDADRNGLVDAEGVQYPHEDGTEDEKPEAVVLAASLVSDEPLSALQASGGMPVPLARLQVALLPAALDVSEPGPPVRLQAVPSGRYAVTVIQFTGQTWRLPNELSPEIAPAFGLTGVESQRFVIEVP